MSLRRSSFAAVFAVLVAMALPTGAGAGGETADDPAKATAKTNKGGSCNLHALIARSGGAITFGGRVPQCSARFGIKQITGRAFLYEDINTGEQAAVTGRVRGNVPFEIVESFTGEADLFYEARFDVTVVIRGGKSKTRPRHPEKWSKAGPGCEIMTSRRESDTLGCVFGLESPPAA